MSRVVLWALLGTAAAGAVALARRLLAPPLPPPSTRTLVVDGRRVFVQVPVGLQAPRTVVYLHGFGTSIDTVASRLAPLFAKAAHPAVLVVPQLGPKSEPGTLGANTGALLRLLKAVGAPTAQVDVLAHSGGYQAAAAIVAGKGGVGIEVSSVGLLDALYGQVDAFAAFARRGTTRHLASVYGTTVRPGTMGPSLTLAKALAPLGPYVHTTPTSTPQDAHLAARIAITATSVAHDAMPAVYGAAMIEAFA